MLRSFVRGARGFTVPQLLVAMLLVAAIASAGIAAMLHWQHGRAVQLVEDASGMKAVDPDQVPVKGTREGVLLVDASGKKHSCTVSWPDSSHLAVTC